MASFPIALLGSGTLAAARSLLGALLVCETDPGPRSGRIVEVEAYVGRDDLASHAHRGPSLRNAVMFGPFGVAYVYLVYGMYECLNVVTEPDGVPGAVLVRAVEPVAGVDLMRGARLERVEARLGRWPTERLERERARMRALPDVRIAAGPGLVCAAMSISRADNGSALCDAASPLRLELPASRETHAAISSGPRIGIGYAAEPWRSHPWRFWLTGNPAVSR